jgi:hypothetical protein
MSFNCLRRHINRNREKQNPKAKTQYTTTQRKTKTAKNCTEEQRELKTNCNYPRRDCRQQLDEEIDQHARDFIATKEERRVRAQCSVRGGRAREREKSIINKFENCFHQWLLHVLFTRIDIRRTRFDSRLEIDDVNEVCFRRLRLFPPRFRDLARPQNRLDNVNTVRLRRLRLLPEYRDFRMDDVNKVFFWRLRLFLHRFPTSDRRYE